MQVVVFKIVNRRVVIFALHNFRKCFGEEKQILSPDDNLRLAILCKRATAEQKVILDTLAAHGLQ